MLLHIKCVLFLPVKIFQSKKNWPIYHIRSKMYIGLHVKYPLLLSGFDES